MLPYRMLRGTVMVIGVANGPLVRYIHLKLQVKQLNWYRFSREVCTCVLEKKFRKRRCWKIVERNLVNTAAEKKIIDFPYSFLKFLEFNKSVYNPFILLREQTLTEPALAKKNNEVLQTIQF